MRNSVIFVGLGVALAAGTSVARAQTVETIVTPAAGPAVVAQAPVAVPPSGVLLPPASTVAVTAPVETVETVHTVTTTEPRRVHPPCGPSADGRSRDDGHPHLDRAVRRGCRSAGL